MEVWRQFTTPLSVRREPVHLTAVPLGAPCLASFARRGIPRLNPNKDFEPGFQINLNIIPFVAPPLRPATLDAAFQSQCSTAKA